MPTQDPPRDEIDITADLVRRLVSAQFPQWADLPIAPVEPGGWDNTTFHLGTDMSVRLPSAARYAAQVEKEHLWLPKLAPHLPVPIPDPLAKGAPGEDYPWSWSIYRWLDGRPASADRIADMRSFAEALAQFLKALHRIDAADGPPPGAHNFYRGGPLATYDNETRHAISALAGEIDTAAATGIWQAALSSQWERQPVWVHGDVAAGNLLVDDGRLCAVIDFGSCGVGDPACDLAIAWTFFEGESREAFHAALALDAQVWARARGWMLWKALITLANIGGANAADAEAARRSLDAVIAEHGRIA